MYYHLLLDDPSVRFPFLQLSFSYFGLSYICFHWLIIMHQTLLTRNRLCVSFLKFVLIDEDSFRSKTIWQWHKRSSEITLLGLYLFRLSLDYKSPFFAHRSPLLFDFKAAIFDNLARGTWGKKKTLPSLLTQSEFLLSPDISRQIIRDGDFRIKHCSAQIKGLFMIVFLSIRCRLSDA